MNYSTAYQDCLTYIDSYWDKIIYKSTPMQLHYRLHLFQSTRKNPNFIEIPRAYFVPNDSKFKCIYYWDSFFMFRGLIGTKRQWLMKEQIENFIYLFNKYKIIPNFNAPASMGRSQPPFLSSMILDAYLTPLSPHNHFAPKNQIQTKLYELKNKTWLKTTMEIAKGEYEIVWIDKENAYNHNVPDYNLSRYGDRDIGYSQSSELESGWDMTSRFYDRCDQFLPIDLNIYLYKYELDFIKTTQILKQKDQESYWRKKADQRKTDINKLMWNNTTGFFYDYNYKYLRLSEFLSLASFTPLWAGLATYDQAKRMLKMLPKFETPYGLTITSKESLAHQIDLSQIQPRYRPAIEEIINPKQWDYPNIWSPLEYLTVIGLLRYGFIEDARRIMKKSITIHAKLFHQHHTFFEKLNGETGSPSTGFRYAMQQGFGWTNTTFYRYIHILDTLDSGTNIYEIPIPPEPPYSLSILH